jgi:hypothetical protein
MATRTVACPECGSESAPGRYTCGACGALLDGVAVRPRTSTAGADPGRAAASATATLPPVRHDMNDGLADLDDDTSPVDEDRPLASEAAMVEAPLAPAAPQWPVREPERQVVWPVREPEREVSWPAPPDRAPIADPESRVPAGAALPPSAVLPPPDAAPAAPTGGPAALGTAAQAPSGDGRSPAERVAEWSSAIGERASVAVREWLDALGPADSRAAVSRRIVATGAGVALFGFLLPWASAPLDVLAANWLDLWGLAGGGHWLIVVGLAALGIVATSRGRTASWPVAMPGVVLGALLLGLVWPYLLGSTGRPFGTLVVLVGAIVVFAGGAIGLAGRHEDATPAV